MEKVKLNILTLDPQLQSYQSHFEDRIQRYQELKHHIVSQSSSLKNFANGYLYYGFHQTKDGWYYREWAPNASALHLIGDFNQWNRTSHPLNKLANGDWEVFIKGSDTLYHRCEVKVQVTADHKQFDRIPLYIHRVIQKPDLHFNGQIWNPKPYVWKSTSIYKQTSLCIYECHIGIASEEHSIATFAYFTNHVLPRIQVLGYNAIQIMGLLEHPYYASFGYQVSNFYALSSRFGTPEEFKQLVDTAHCMGIMVLCDMVHSHASSNTEEGIHMFDGTEYQFFHAGNKGNHPTWGTKCFHYGKLEVIHFLLSNLKYWMDEYHIDGFRFDGVTSMIYSHHGLHMDFLHYNMYFSSATDMDALLYLQLANELIHEIQPGAITIAEDVSGMPGLCIPIYDGGIGFDYRLSMGVTDHWIHLLRNVRDEAWDMGHLWHEMIQHRPMEKMIAYCESHDQSIVGGKTIMFWLAGQQMYQSMDIHSDNIVIDRAIALHKMIRLLTCASAGEGYLNFMGNEFGHPEWIDLPRAGNDDSYQYARRQWSLVDHMGLRYYFLNAFDADMITFIKENLVQCSIPSLIILDDHANVIIFQKENFIFGFNFHPSNTYMTELPKGYITVLPILDTTWSMYGGFISKKYQRCESLKLFPRTAIIWNVISD